MNALERVALDLKKDKTSLDKMEILRYVMLHQFNRLQLNFARNLKKKQKPLLIGLCFMDSLSLMIFQFFEIATCFDQLFL